MNDNGNHKRQRMSPPPTPDIDDMEVAQPPANGDNSSSRSRAGSNASSDWDDWADAMVAQGEPPGESAAAGGAPGGGVGGGGGGGMAVDEQDEEWVRSLMEQGTVGSVIEGMESPAWDYVLQMVVEEREVRCTDGVRGTLHNLRVCLISRITPHFVITTVMLVGTHHGFGLSLSCLCCSAIRACSVVDAVWYQRWCLRYNKRNVPYIDVVVDDDIFARCSCSPLGWIPTQTTTTARRSGDGRIPGAGDKGRGRHRVRLPMAP